MTKDRAGSDTQRRMAVEQDGTVVPKIEGHSSFHVCSETAFRTLPYCIGA